MQDIIHTLSQAYVKTTNAYLVEHGLEKHIIDPTTIPRGGTQEAGTTEDGKKEKKKRVHDPNAPKRPLTPFFLYMQTARPIIAADLGSDVPKKAVGAEGVRRWKEMADGDKQLWTNAYTDNLKLYNARVHAYKAGDLSAKDMTDEEAAHYADTHQIAVLPDHETPDLGADAQAPETVVDIPADVPSTPTSPEASPEPVPEPLKVATPKAQKPRAKKAKNTSSTSTPAQPEAPIVPSSVTKAASPDKKRKRTATKKGDDEVVASIEKENETPKNKSSRKKKPRGVNE